MNKIRLGVNIDHVATLRNARGGSHPDPVLAALLSQSSGADGITAHLREDRRHIRDADIYAIKAAISLPLNFEMAATKEMLNIALDVRPNAVCIVPEKREEVTTEGGLAVAGHEAELSPIIAALKQAGIRVSLFVDAKREELDASAQIGADIVEIHTGQYCDAPMGPERKAEINKIAEGVAQSLLLGLEVHAGHGLSFETVGAIAKIPGITELNIGHFIMGEALFTGLPEVIGEMQKQMKWARDSA